MVKLKYSYIKYTLKAFNNFKYIYIFIYIYIYKSFTPAYISSFTPAYPLLTTSKQEVDDNLSLCVVERSPCDLSKTGNIRINQCHVVKR